jgi:squalene-hopene/tetraprenyl-beta-curcumene cyclase
LNDNAFDKHASRIQAAVMIRISLCLMIAGTALAAELPSQTDISLLKEVDSARARGVAWLVQQQEADGSWRHHPAITALAVTSLIRAKAQPEAVERGLKFILSNVKTNGAIYGGGEADKYPNYSTAICSMALLAAGKPEYRQTILDARQFLLASQFDETRGVASTNASYGGIGYGKRERPDLSNMQWTLEAIHLTESMDADKKKTWELHWQKAIQFLQRCQKLPAHNDQPWAKNAADQDLGGFIYMPGPPPVSFADDEVQDGKTPLRSYGSMSYAGLKSYLYAELKKDDPRVVAAVSWLRKNYSVDENPGLGAQGLYYYYLTFTKALTAYNEDTFTDAAGKTHDWRFELMKKLVTLQRFEGYWQNDNNRWWENDPVLVTSYSLLSLEILQSRRHP